LDSLAAHRAYLDSECAASRAAPLSRRKAMLAAMLIDAYADRLFAADARGGDILAFRAALASVSPALATIFALCAQREGGPRLAIEAVTVPIAEYATLAVEDFMVSLYNGSAVQRLLVVHPEGGREDAHAVLAAAARALPAGP